MSVDDDRMSEPLIVSTSYAEESWSYSARLAVGESLEDAFRRVFWVVVHDVLPSFGEPREVKIYSRDKQHAILADLPESHADRVALFERSMPAHPNLEATIGLNTYLRTASGRFAQSGSVAMVMIDPAVDSVGIEVTLHVDGVVYRPPEPDDDPAEIRQYEYNRNKLPLFLGSLQYALGATFSGRSSDEAGPNGYLEPGADQTGLP